MPLHERYKMNFQIKEELMRKFAMQLMVIGITVLTMAMPALAAGGGGPW
jgi:hypothetical protein